MAHDHGLQGPVSRRRLVKSRTGCTSCRARKVKCDERRPICSNCAKRYIDSQPCVYSEVAVRQTTQRGRNERDTDHFRSVSTSSAIVGRGLMLEPGSTQPNNQLRSLELRLMHHYTSVVCRTMPDCNGETARDMWSRIIPQIAFDSEVVLNPMLALSALHLHAHSPDNAPMSLAISRYLDRTLVDHRNALQSYDGALTEQIWLSAVLLSNLYWLLAHQRRSDEPYELPFHGWRMMYGVTMLFLRKHTILREMGYEWYGHVSADAMEEHHKLSFDSVQQLKLLEDDLFNLMQGFETRLCAKEAQDAYYQAQAYIVSFYRAYLCGTEPKILRMFVGTMPIKCPPLYMKLLEKHDPLAMALMARLLVLLVPIETAWWINGIGEYEVVSRDIQGITDLMPEHLRWSMTWPHKVLSGDILLSR